MTEQVGRMRRDIRSNTYFFAEGDWVRFGVRPEYGDSVRVTHVSGSRAELAGGKIFLVAFVPRNAIETESHNV